MMKVKVIAILFYGLFWGACKPCHEKKNNYLKEIITIKSLSSPLHGTKINDIYIQLLKSKIKMI